MELTMRLLVCPIALFAVLLLVPTIEALEGYPSLSTSLTGFGNGRRPQSREEELMNALQFLEEYERNLGDTRVGVEEEDDWSPQEAFPFLERNDPDEDIVPDDFWESDDDENDGNTEELNIFLQNLLQGANSNDVMISNRYYTPQRSSFSSNNQDVLFSPVDADLEDEIKLDVEIEKLKVQQKEEKLWEDILGDMMAEEILEADAREDMKELIDAEEEEAQLEDVLEEDTIFEEAPWSEAEYSDAAEESDVVPMSWAWAEWEGGEESTSSSLDGSLDTMELTSEEEDKAEREAALLLLEEMLAEEEEKERQEEEQQEILEMVLGDESSYEEAEDESSVDEFTEEAIENYFRALLDNNPDEEILYDDDDEDIILGTSSEAEVEGSDQTSSEFDIWDQLSSVPETEGEFIQEIDLSDEDEPEDDTIDYEQLLRAIDNEIQAAADEVEEEMVAALTERIEKKNSMRYLEEEDEFEDTANDASNEINEVDAANFLAELLYQQQEKRTGSATCPVLSNLVDSCAFIKGFPDIDIDRDYYRNIFHRACNRHQLCYTCGANYDIEAKLCDEVFDAEMLAECGQDDDECSDVASQFLLIATNTHPRMSQPPKQCQAKCLLQFLIED